MKILLAALNAKYIHSSLALRSIKAYAEQNNIKTEIIEFTINQQQDYIIQELFQKQPDLLGFSCYIWNIEIIKELICELHKVLPNTIFVLGGPEVSYDSKSVLKECPANIIVRGEGEMTFTRLCKSLISGEDIDGISGITFNNHSQIVENYNRTPLKLDEIPFPYENLSGLENRIIYYESSRGCPYSCGYCLSSAEAGVRSLSHERVFSDLQFFLDSNVRQVKFVDRTFNCSKRHAMAIWRYLSEHDNEITNFHFEINAATIDDEEISFLQTVRKALFQFEIGIQTTNSQTLNKIHRSNDMNKIKRIVDGLQKNKNIHLHLDLIAGLPEEDFKSFGQSFNYVYSLRPDQLQLGFLKVLKGTDIHKRSVELGLVHKDKAPYEILFTPKLNFSDVLELKKIEDMVEDYYNSNRFKKTIGYLCSYFEEPFEFFRELASFYYDKEYHAVNHSKEFGYTALYEYMINKGIGDHTHFKWLAKYDMYSHEKARRLPDWLDVDLNHKNRTKIYEFFNSNENIAKYLPEYAGLEGKQIARMAHLEMFPFNPESGKDRETAIIFNYKNQDLLGNAATKALWDF